MRTHIVPDPAVRAHDPAPAGQPPIHPLRALGPKYPPHDAGAPILEGMDVAGLALAIVMTLGPLAAYALGMGA